MKRLFGSDRRFGDLNLWINGWGPCSGSLRIRADSEDQDFLASVIDGHVLVGLEETELSDALGGDAAGGEIGDASGFELEAHVGDINFAGKNGQANGANFLHGRIDEGEDDIEVVDHQVEDNVDIERAWGKDAEPVHFKKHRMSEQRKRGADGGIEAFEVADLHDAFVSGGELLQFIDFGEGGGERLFDEDIDLLLHERAGDLEMMDRGRCD